MKIEKDIFNIEAIPHELHVQIDIRAYFVVEWELCWPQVLQRAYPSSNRTHS